jgi:hypothetical protein
MLYCRQQQPWGAQQQQGVLAYTQQQQQWGALPCGLLLVRQGAQ